MNHVAQGTAAASVRIVSVQIFIRELLFYSTDSLDKSLLICLQLWIKNQGNKRRMQFFSVRCQ